MTRRKKTTDRVMLCCLLSKEEAKRFKLYAERHMQTKSNLLRILLNDMQAGYAPAPIEPDASGEVRLYAKVSAPAAALLDKYVAETKSSRFAVLRGLVADLNAGRTPTAMSAPRQQAAG